MPVRITSLNYKQPRYRNVLSGQPGDEVVIGREKVESEYLEVTFRLYPPFTVEHNKPMPDQIQEKLDDAFPYKPDDMDNVTPQFIAYDKPHRIY